MFPEKFSNREAERNRPRPRIERALATYLKLIECARSNRGNTVGKIRKLGGKNKLMPQLGIEPLPFACEASPLTTEPPGPVVVEVTRMPNALG